MSQLQKGENLLQSVDNALRLLEIFSENEMEFSLGELSRRLGLGKSTVHRLLATLGSRGYIARNKDNGKFQLGMQLLYLGGLVLKQINLIKLGHLYLERLSQEVGETVHMVILDQLDVVFIDKVSSSRPMQMGSRVGGRMPAHCTGTGKILLAYLPENELQLYLKAKKLVRYTNNTITEVEVLKNHLRQSKELGYAVDREEIEEGLLCIAAPVRDIHGKVIAAISISGLVTRLSIREQELADKVKETAKAISTAMGWNE